MIQIFNIILLGDAFVEKQNLNAVVTYSVCAAFDENVQYQPISANKDQLLLRIFDYVQRNYIWHFMPAVGDAAAAPTADWGTAYVPGAWYRAGWPDFRLEGVAREGESWRGTNYTKLNRAWYERSFTVPERWRDKRIVLNIIMVPLSRPQQEKTS